MGLKEQDSLYLILEKSNKLPILWIIHNEILSIENYILLHFAYFRIEMYTLKM